MKRLLVAMCAWSALGFSLILGGNFSASAQEVTDLNPQAATPQPTPAPATPPPPAVQAAAPAAPAPSSPYDLSGNIKFFPIAYDDEWGDYYINLIPSLNLGTTFNALGTRKGNLGFGDTLELRYFVTDEKVPADEVHYYNTATLTGDVDVIDKLNLGTYFGLETTHAAQDAAGIEEWWFENDTRFTYKVLPSTSVFLGYNFVYDLYPGSLLGVDKLDANDNPAGLPNEPIFPGTGGTGLFSFGSGVSGGDNDWFVYWHAIKAGVKHKFTDKISGSAEHKFGRLFSNNDNWELVENETDLKLNVQVTPKTTIGTRYRFRVWDYIYAMASNGVDGGRMIRHRLYLTASQMLTKAVGLEFNYRLELRRFDLAGKTDEDRLQGWFGVVVNF